MKKLILGTLMVVFLAVLGIGGVFALPQNRGIDTAKASRAIDENGELRAPPEFVAQLPESQLTKIVFIRYAPGKEPKCNENKICEAGENWKNCPSDCKKGGGGDEGPTPTETACYDFLAGSKPRWNWVEDYYYSDSTLESPSFDAVTTWETPTSAEIFGNALSENYPWGVYDYKNSLSYGDYDDAGMCPTAEPCVIAVTAIWFRGKNIYEYDVRFDTDFFFPGSTIDLPTVVLHEFGHGAGLGDIYDGMCANNVMYGYYHEEDLDLGTGDITGIQQLYGS